MALHLCLAFILYASSDFGNLIYGEKLQFMRPFVFYRIRFFLPCLLPKVPHKEEKFSTYNFNKESAKTKTDESKERINYNLPQFV